MTTLRRVIPAQLRSANKASKMRHEINLPFVIPDLRDKTVVIENRDVDSFQRLYGLPHTDQRVHLLCYWLDEKLINTSYGDEHTALVYKTYTPDTPLHRNILVYRPNFIAAAPVLAMISDATHAQDQRFDVSILCEQFSRKAWETVTAERCLSLIDSISISYIEEVNMPYEPDFSAGQPGDVIRQIRRDRSMPAMIEAWVRQSFG
jgi:hypothetical protein